MVRAYRNAGMETDRMLQQLWAVARNTFLETIRQPVFVVLLIGGLLLLALNPAICAFSMETEGEAKMLVDLGLSTMLVAGLLLAAFSAAGVFSREIENQTVLTVISKPVGRPAFVLGKYLGVSSGIAVACAAWSFALLLTVRHGVLVTADQELDAPVVLYGSGAFFAGIGLAAWGNYFYRWVFPSALTALLVPLLGLAYLLALFTGKHWELQPPGADFKPQLWIAMLLVLLALCLISAVAIAASIRLRQVPTLLICVGVFLTGLSSDYVFGQAARNGSMAAEILHRIVPNIGYLWQADALSQGSIIPFSHVSLLAAYTGLWICGILSLAIALFQTREVG